MTPTFRTLALLILALVPALSRGEAVLGEPAPDFKAVSADGKTYALGDLKGKWVVLEWTNKDCPFVKKHYGPGAMQKAQKTYTAKGVVWLSVVSSAKGKEGYVDADGALANAKAVGSAATAVLLDPEGVMGHAYGARTTPHMFVINPEGRIAYAGPIDDNPSPDPKTLEGTHNYVAAALDAGLAGKEIEVKSSKAYGCGVKYGSPAEAEGLKEGTPAPDFSLQDAQGHAVALKDLRGRNVLLYFYPRDDTPGCTKEACGFRDLWKGLQDAGVAVFGVSPDGAASHQAFIKKYDLPFPLLSDPDHRMIQAYGAWGGKFVTRSSVWIGPDGTIRKHWKRVADVVGHPAEVLEAMKGAKAP